MSEEIIQLHLQGKSIPEISEITSKSYYFIRRVIKELEDINDSKNDK